MIARKMGDGVIELDVQEAELALILKALQTYAGDLAARSAALEQEARGRRELSDRFARGRHANRRVAGELEHAARKIDEDANQTLDIVRAISGLGRRPKTELPVPSQIEEGHHGEE